MGHENIRIGGLHRYSGGSLRCVSRMVKVRLLGKRVLSSNGALVAMFTVNSSFIAPAKTAMG